MLLSQMIGKHQTQDYVNYGEIYSTAQILGNSSSKGIAKKTKMKKKYYSSICLRFKLSFTELQHSELPEKYDSKFVKFWKSKNWTAVTVS